MDSQAVDYLPTFAAQAYNVMFVSAGGVSDSLEMVEEQAGAAADDDAEAGVENGEPQNENSIAPLFEGGYLLKIDPEDTTDYTTPQLKEKIEKAQRFFIGLEQVMPAAIESSTPWRDWEATLLLENYESLFKYHQGVAVLSKKKIDVNLAKAQKRIKIREERQAAWERQTDKSVGVRDKSREHHVRASALQGAGKMRESALELASNSKLSAEEKEEKQKNRKNRQDELDFLQQWTTEDQDDLEAQQGEQIRLRRHRMTREDLKAADEYHKAEDDEMESNVNFKPSKKDEEFINDKKIKMKSKKQKRLEQALEEEEDSDLDVPLPLLKNKCKNQTDKKGSDDEHDTGENGAQALGTLTFENIIV